jgi:hypothetical protein
MNLDRNKLKLKKLFVKLVTRPVFWVARLSNHNLAARRVGVT